MRRSDCVLIAHLFRAGLAERDRAEGHGERRARTGADHVLRFHEVVLLMLRKAGDFPVG